MTDQNTAEIIQPPAEVANDPEALQSPDISRRALAVAKSYECHDDDDADALSSELAQISNAWNAMDAKRKFLKEPSLEASRRVDNFFRPYLEDLDAAKVQLRRVLGAYLDEKARQQRIKDDEARRVADQNRETARLAAIAAEEKANAAELEGKDLEAEHHVRVAEEQRSVAEKPAVYQAPAQVRKVAGVGTSKPWKGEVFDIDLLIRAAAEHPHLRGMLKIDDSGVTAFAKATKGSTEVPGVRFYQDTQVRIAAKRGAKS